MASVKGWCPNLYAPMDTGDGVLLRVKPFGGRLSVAQARALAAIAPGAIELTNRANLQLRGASAESAPALAQALVAAGLADADPGREARRNLIAPPLLGDDPTIPAGALGWRDALAGVLDSAGTLPGKFGLVLEAGGVLPLAGVEGDITLRLAADGTAWLRLQEAPWQARGATPGQVATLVEAFRASGAKRMRGAVERLGAAALFAAAGLVPEATASAAPAVPEVLGFHPYPGGARGGFGLMPEFGVLDGAGLLALADLAERFGDGTLRLTPWRAVLLGGVTQPAALAAEAAGWVTDPADPRRRIIACPGSEGCASGLAPVRRDARALLAQGAVPARGLLHLSGCAKGCAHPAPAAAVLVAGRDGYALLRQAHAGDTPLRSGLTLAEAAAELENE
ncbi:precorrin-3B synthase [Teichococcus cervicalis]|uniref:Precorrin-3B synthase n=1 Tax=Pseudoroseomonas cervicalis ATCC 49957 TaxID=525371 RepID=D5RL33_9PROT|nr:precorrin-3B synthase [Pseudoroseomonas cervicalis]EFH11971.1 precorrin-3B synthase [Pseudoroseomonas cervicalis ATCC 49957]